jgi:hypothetical protein
MESIKNVFLKHATIINSCHLLFPLMFPPLYGSSINEALPSVFVFLKLFLLSFLPCSSFLPPAWHLSKCLMSILILISTFLFGIFLSVSCLKFPLGFYLHPFLKRSNTILFCYSLIYLPVYPAVDFFNNFITSSLPLLRILISDVISLLADVYSLVHVYVSAL